MSLNNDTTFQTVIEMVLKHEGGYVDHPSDPGGETNFGISKRAYPDVDIKKLTPSTAAEIYRQDYWNRISGDSLPAGVGVVVMDYAVNSGVSRASKALQSVCNAGKDGIIGPHTLNAVHIACNDNGQEFVIEGVTNLRREFIRGLSIYDTFSRGWERRIDETYAKAMELI